MAVALKQMPPGQQKQWRQGLPESLGKNRREAEERVEDAGKSV